MLEVTAGPGKGREPNLRREVDMGRPIWSLGGLRCDWTLEEKDEWMDSVSPAGGGIFGPPPPGYGVEMNHLYNYAVTKMP